MAYFYPFVHPFTSDYAIFKACRIGKLQEEKLKYLQSVTDEKLCGSHKYTSQSAMYHQGVSPWVHLVKRA
jgi:hypothetical protein